ncbi:hypothetical protein NLB65_00145 [Candidatus Aminicenantes bacterium AC-335-B20]|nr:hypothetical protein [SCandidatus Aminicenantes bacterium Aminicenantia_JdfR_composite]MCP2598541.1 hypothetical protein [Candidatus Aminicenantes bacterium AC-335-L06]MCP2598854.1 hypothetical protein [Candidatus Aminicenantes bacterium AC-335-B20]MCP2621033.1 hypothetical protein [Candidatus Aminicenantes bacterium AC-334-E05]
MFQKKYFKKFLIICSLITGILTFLSLFIEYSYNYELSCAELLCPNPSWSCSGDLIEFDECYIECWRGDWYYRVFCMEFPG